MSANSKDIGSDLAKVDAYVNTAADYDEIPEVTDEQFVRAIMHRDGKPVRGRPPVGAAPKKAVSLRLDAEIEARFRTSGPGWQGRMNTFLAHNEAVLQMIDDFEQNIRNTEELISQFRAGGVSMLTESLETSIAKAEYHIGIDKKNVRGLRDLLRWEPLAQGSID